MTVKHEHDDSNSTIRKFNPGEYSPDIGLKFSYSRYEDNSVTSKEKFAIQDSVINNNGIIKDSVKSNVLASEDVPEKPTLSSKSNIESSSVESNGLNDAGIGKENSSSKGENGDVLMNGAPDFRLQLASELGVIEERDESQELSMDYPSLSPLDINEVKARRREMEAKKFQQELDKMALQLADRLKKIPASSRRSYKKESIYVRDLYTLTYEEGETVESLGYTTVSTGDAFVKISLCFHSMNTNNSFKGCDRSLLL